MSNIFNPLDWYWLRADDRLYSSSRQAVVPKSDKDYSDWSDRGNYPTLWPKDETGAQTDAALQDVLSPYGLVLPTATSASDSLVTYAAAKRYAVETGGITVNGAKIATDRESQAMIGNAFAYVQTASAPSVSYKSLAGFVTLTADQIKGVALAVGAHVQACFDAEAATVSKITAKKPSITDKAGVDAAFAEVAN
jgi:hypothetical protein